MSWDLVVNQSHEPPECWDEWLESIGCYAGARQTRGRAIQYAAEYGGLSYFLEARTGEHRVAAMLASWIPTGGRFGRLKRIAEILGGCYSRIEVFEGPAVSSGNLSYAEPLLDRLDALGSHHRAAGIRLSCFPYGYDVSIDSQFHDVLTRHGYYRIEWQTSVVSLTTSESQAFSELRNKERSGIRKCESTGVALRECANEEDFMNLFIGAYYENRLDEARIAKARRQWNATLPKHYRYFVAVASDGQVLATLATYRFNGYVTIRRIKRTLAGKNSRLPIQDFLHWQVMNFHRSLGDQWFDMAGFSPEPANEKESGIRFFKTKWGGTLKSTPRYVKDLRPRLQRVLPILNRTSW